MKTRPLEDLEIRYRRLGQHRLDSASWFENFHDVLLAASNFGSAGMSIVAPYLLFRIRDDRNLIVAANHLATHSPYAAGPDGQTMAEIREDDSREQGCFCQWIRLIRLEIDQGHYRHCRTRKIFVPKSSGGKRVIEILNLTDRLVHRAIAQVLTPLFDSRFSPFSFGGRPRRNRMQALAVLAELVERGSRVIVVEDLTDAFPSVPVKRVLQQLERYIPIKHEDEYRRRPLFDNSIDAYKARLLTKNVPLFFDQTPESLHGLLKRAIYRGKRRGLRQGAATSPLMLNLYCDQFLDRPWRRRRHEPLLRYVDDLCIPCRTASDAAEAIQVLRQLTDSAGFKLKRHGKGLPTVVDLNAGETLDWLGYRVTLRGEQVRVELPDDWLDRLRRNLLDRRARGNVWLRAVVLGWVEQLGPAYDPTIIERVYREIEATAMEAGLRPMPSPEEFTRRWERSHQRWLDARQWAAKLLRREKRLEVRTRRQTNDASTSTSSTC